jgi:hypothetical protein
VIDRALVDALVARLERCVAFSVSIAEGELYLSIGTDNLTGSGCLAGRARRDSAVAPELT